MHYRAAFLRKPSIRRFFAAQSPNTRSMSTQSSNSPFQSPVPSIFEARSRFDQSNGGDSALESIVRSLSSVVIVAGSGLGFCYWCCCSESSPHLCYADSGSQNWGFEKNPKFLFGDLYRKKVFFKYEKRVRMQSSPEKVFEYFASFKSPSGEIFMTPTDLMRAVVPVFPPSEASGVRGGYLKGEWVTSELNCAPSKFFMLFDTNNDGLISFAEYIFFVTLLSIPESSFSVAFKMFDIDDNGKIDKEEFKKVMALMRTYNRQGAGHKNGLRIGLKVSTPVENGGLLEYFFGKDGEDCLEHGRFVQFLRDLHDEILRLEFAHYDYKGRGTISAKDFALSMVASADMRHINTFLDRIDELHKEPIFRDMRITFEEFKNFAELRQRLQSLTLAIFGYGKVNGLLTKRDFRRAAYRVCGVSLADNLIDIIFYIFDTNGDGNLSADEFIRVLQRREKEILIPRNGGFAGLMSCWLECTNDCYLSRLIT